MKSISTLEVEEVGVLDEARNRFYGKSGNFLFEVRQPRKKDSSEHRRAWRDLSNYTLRRYMRQQFTDSNIYDPKWRCRQPLYRGEVPGFMPLIMVVNGRIVGFADMMFKYGTDFLYHDIDKDEVGCSMNLCVLDKYQGLGIGSFYSQISAFICSHFKADWMLGFTPFKKGMFNIRMKDDWKHLGTYGRYAIIRKRI